MGTEINIYKALRRNRIITISAVSLCAVTVISSFVFAFSVYAYQMNHALTLDKNGDVLPLKYIPINDALKIGAAHHVEMFHKNFYEYDKFSFEKRMEKALWLGGESVEQHYLKLQNEGWFQRVIKLSITQEIQIEPDNIIIEGDKLPFQFKASCIIRIKQYGEHKSYAFETRGIITDVHKNYPLNPHGLLIESFEEYNKNEIENESGY